MPIYEFQCDECQRVFSKISSLGEDGTTIECPHCSHTPVRKLFSTFATSGAGVGHSVSSSGAESSCVSRGPFT